MLNGNKKDVSLIMINLNIRLTRNGDKYTVYVKKWLSSYLNYFS